MDTQLRKIKLTRFADGSGEGQIPAKFHNWGYKNMPLDNGLDIAISVGIIEYENGKVDMVDPRRIFFVDGE